MYRRNLKHSRVKNIFKFVSSKMNQILTVESRLEFDTCFHFEYSTEIEHFIAQPEGFYYSYQDKQYPYTPDFLIIDKGVKKFVEVKPWAKAQSVEFHQRFSAKQKQVNQHNIPLILVTDKQIRVNPVLNNLKLLHRYSGFQSLTPLHQSLLDIVRRSNQIQIKNLAKYLSIEYGIAIKMTLGLLSSGLLYTNLTAQELNLESFVWCDSDE